MAQLAARTHCALRTLPAALRGGPRPPTAVGGNAGGAPHQLLPAGEHVHAGPTVLPAGNGGRHPRGLRAPAEPTAGADRGGERPIVLGRVDGDGGVLPQARGRELPHAGLVVQARWRRRLRPPLRGSLRGPARVARHRRRVPRSHRLGPHQVEGERLAAAVAVQDARHFIRGAPAGAPSQSVHRHHRPQQVLPKPSPPPTSAEVRDGEGPARVHALARPWQAVRGVEAAHRRPRLHSHWAVPRPHRAAARPVARAAVRERPLRRDGPILDRVGRRVHDVRR